MSNSMKIACTINKKKYSLNVDANKRLLDVLRDDLDLIATKECCGIGECGACTILLNGRAVNSCLVLAAEADGAEIVTAEGLGDGENLDALQRAFLDHGAVQCGFCIPSQLISAEYLLAQNPHPTREEVEEGMAGNLCRCGGYERIIDAVISVAEKGGSK